MYVLWQVLNMTCKQFFDSISGCIKEYGMVVCINGMKKKRRWNIGGCEISEVDEYKYIRKCRFKWVFKSMEDRIIDANVVLGIGKYTASIVVK